MAATGTCRFRSRVFPTVNQFILCHSYNADGGELALRSLMIFALLPAGERFATVVAARQALEELHRPGVRRATDPANHDRPQLHAAPAVQRPPQGREAAER